jgi:hypothetical protein
MERLTGNGVDVVKAFFRNLLIGGIFALVAAQAQAQPAVVWTFSGLPFTELDSTDGTPLAATVTGGLQAGGTMTFDASGNLIDFNFVTTGGPFGFTYTPDTAIFFAPDDTDNNPLVGHWSFAALDDGAQYILALGLDGTPNGWAAGPISQVAIIPGDTAESYGKSGSDFNGTFRVPGDIDLDDLNLTAAAVQVPEPASIALLGTALLGLGFASRRRNRNSA